MQSQRARIASTAVAVFAMVLSVSCSTSGTELDADANLDIRVVRGPINPVEIEGESNVVAVPRALVSARPLPSGEVIRVETDDDGGARLSLPSGLYSLEVTRCPAGTLFAKGQDVRIAMGEQTSATLVCDTGIR